MAVVFAVTDSFVAKSCAPVMASFENWFMAPSATFTILRLKLLLPTETVKATSAIEFAPRATLSLAVALERAPNASASSAVAAAFSPIAIAIDPVVLALYPMLIDPNAFSRVPSPIALAPTIPVSVSGNAPLTKAAWALLPIAIESWPALAFDPQAKASSSADRAPARPSPLPVSRQATTQKGRDVDRKGLGIKTTVDFFSGPTYRVKAGQLLLSSH